MITHKNVKKALGLVDTYVRSEVELATTPSTVTERMDMAAKTIETQDAMESYLGSLVTQPKHKRSAYVCSGCGGIYWIKDINCDCNVPKEPEHKLIRVTVYSKNAFNVKRSLNQ